LKLVNVDLRLSGVSSFAIAVLREGNLGKPG